MSIKDVRSQGVDPVRTFFGQEGRDQFFAIWYGRLLWTAPNPVRWKSVMCRNNV